MIVHLSGSNDDPTRPDRPARTGPARPARPSGAREKLAKVLEDPKYLEIKERLGEPLTPGERFRLELARAGSAQPGDGSAQPEGGDPCSTPTFKRGPRPPASAAEDAPRPVDVRYPTAAVKRYDRSPLFHHVQCRRGAALRRAILALTSAACAGR